MTAAERTPAAPASQLNPVELLRSRRYLVLLVVAAIVGVPVSAAAYWFLVFVTELQGWLYSDLPGGLGYGTPPVWWPLPILVVGGVLVAVIIRWLPGRGGESPIDGFHAGRVAAPITIPGVALAAVATLGSGAVLGPEAPLIVLGGGVAAWAVRLAKRDAPAQMSAVVGAAGSFAAISTLLGSPLLGAFLLMEASGLGGPLLGLMLLPGLLAAGVGSLIFLGLDSWTGHGTFSLAVPNLPPFTRPDVAEFGWALVIGLAAAVVAALIRALALVVRSQVERRIMLLTPVVGAVVAGLAILYGQLTDHDASEVLFSGQTALAPLITNAAQYSIGAILLLLVCKALAYGVSLGAFRGGPTFPAMFIGGAGGIAMSHLPGLSLVPAVAMGIGAMSVSMLRLPLTSVLLVAVLLASDSLAVVPLAIVAVVVAHVATARLTWGQPPAPAVPPNTSAAHAADEAPAMRAG
jgi:H+/Cl- antiporter ClcA